MFLANTIFQNIRNLMFQLIFFYVYGNIKSINLELCIEAQKTNSELTVVSRI